MDSVQKNKFGLMSLFLTLHILPDVEPRRGTQCRIAKNLKSELSLIHFIYVLVLAVTCPENTNYTSCGNPCPLTCVDILMGNMDATCDEKCVESCECPEGKVLDDEICVDAAECGCFVDGFYYSVSLHFIHYSI